MLWKTVWHFFQKLKIEKTHNAVLSLLGLSKRALQSLGDSTKDLKTATQMATEGRADKSSE